MNQKDLTQCVDWDAIQQIIETFFWQILDNLPEEERELHAKQIAEEDDDKNQIIQKGLSAQEDAALNLLK